jgi:glyoxylase-like metal-dependent hydrolase (beta-lactamase superfamily II)/ferredoxin
MKKTGILLNSFMLLIYPNMLSLVMASLKKAHQQNVTGPLFVDTTCIDCGTCFHLGPAIFDEAQDDRSYVMKQPQNLQEWTEAKMAILSCPTNSIGVHEAPEAFKAAPTTLPLKVHENIFYCGYTSRDSFGATTYLIEREEGNILIDSPRFHPILVKELDKKGGVKYMYLSHQDDVADHDLFAEHFKCQRIIHGDDQNHGTKDVEIVLKGEDTFQLDPEILIIPTPGHSKGHTVLLYQNKYLFTGDHLFYSHQQLSASKNVCWYSWPKQVASIHKLLNYEFEWILPGHGGWGHLSPLEIKKQLKNFSL